MKIREKLLLAPGSVLILMLVLGLVGLMVLNSAKNSLEDIYTVHFQSYKSSSQALQNVSKANANVYRLFTWLSNYDEAKIKLATNDITKLVDAAAEELKQLQTNSDLTEGERNSLVGIQGDLVKYRKEVVQAVDYAQIDANMGITSMQTADQTFTALQKKVANLVDVVDTASKNQYERSAVAYRRSFALFIAIMAAAIAVGVAVSYVLGRKIIEPLKQAIGAAQSIAGGDLTGRIETAANDETGTLLRALSKMQSALREVISDVTRNSSELSQMAGLLSGSSTHIADDTGQQSDAASAMAASVEEMTVSIGMVSENAREADKSVRESSRISVQGRGALSRVEDAMRNITTSVNDSATIIKTLGEESERISAIVNVIKDIADQTNLLALNAAIEAARAGEQGRGFAVVADEVRKLAERTTHSTQEIAAMIQAIQGSTHNAVSSMQSGVGLVEGGVQLVSEAGAAISQVERYTDQVVSMVSEISSSLGEQSAASQQIATHVEHIAQMAERNTVASRDTAHSAQRMEALATGMQAMVSRFKI